MPDVNF